MKRREFLRMLAILPVVGVLFGIDGAQEEAGTLAPILSHHEYVDLSNFSWIDNNTVIAWNDDIVIKSTSGGMTWEEIPSLIE